MTGRSEYGYVLLALSRSPYRGELIRIAYPQDSPGSVMGADINMATSPLPSRRPHSGESPYGQTTDVFSGSTKWRDIIEAT